MKFRVTIPLICLAAFESVLLVGQLIAQDRQPHMQAAMDHLQKAKAELQQAEHDKDGHREKALQLTDSAITEVKAGIHFANQEHK